DFWRNKIENENYNLSDEDIDAIIRIIDDKASGHKVGMEAIAKTGIRQNYWRKVFRDFEDKKELRLAFAKILYAKEDDNLADLSDELLVINKSNKNGLNGRERGMINAFLFLINPKKYISVVSLNHRRLISEYFKIENNLSGLSDGEKIIKSGEIILEACRKNLDPNLSPRTISEFLYLPFNPYNEDLKIKSLWYKKDSKSSKRNNVEDDFDSDTFLEIKLKKLEELKGEKKYRGSPDNYQTFSKSFLDKQKKNDEIGKKGEKFVLDEERKRLKKLNINSHGKEPKNMSNTNAGYDILSYNKDGSDRYIEVKSSTSKKLTSFFITEHELEIAKNYRENYYIYIVTDVSGKKPKIRIINNPDFSNDK
ncbi:DUF3883 domain-containing protein, partial [Candidatus Falkowbacteria bacterium]|nr:DUF3883 domain-containing protein [Candidatus Falkowbacteria bacterium]